MESWLERSRSSGRRIERDCRRRGRLVGRSFEEKGDDEKRGVDCADEQRGESEGLEGGHSASGLRCLIAA